MTMGSRRFALVLLGLATAALVGTVPATAKEGVKATLETSIPLDAAAGTPLDVAWTLAYVDEDGRRQPFGAGGIFVRLSSAAGAGSQTAFARGDTGDYKATVLVPTGGIGDVQIGIRGFADGRPSDLLFPITNDPLPGVRRVAAPTSRQAPPDEPGTGSTAWIFIVAAGGLATLALFAVALVRRRNASAGASASPGPEFCVRPRATSSAPCGCGCPTGRGMRRRYRTGVPRAPR